MAEKLNVRKRRLELGLSQEQLADKLGVCVMTIYRAEKKNRLPKNRLVREALQRELA